ncbi:hypothetical protein Tco_1098017, partial [Tanacetum coccineum]
MDDDLFTYEVEIANIPCDSKMDDDSEHEADDDMGYDPRDDEVKLTDEESSDDMDEVAKTYLLRTLRDSRPMNITRMIRSMNGTRTCHGSMRSHGLTPEFRPNPHQLNILASLSTIRLDVQNGQHVDYEWYKALEDSELKNEALRNKAIMEGFIKEDDDDKMAVIGESSKRQQHYENYNSEDQYAVSIKEDTSYPCLHSPKTTEDETQYAVFNIWNEYNILEDIKRGPYSKKSLIRRIQLLGYAVEFRRISLIGFRSCASRSQTGASQSRQST